MSSDLSDDDVVVSLDYGGDGFGSNRGIKVGVDVGEVVEHLERRPALEREVLRHQLGQGGGGRCQDEGEHNLQRDYIQVTVEGSFKC